MCYTFRMSEERKFRILEKKPVVQDEYIPKTDEEMAHGRARKEGLLQELENSRSQIESVWQRALKKEESTFTLSVPWDLSGGVLTHARVADIVRAWVVEAYQGRLGLERYDEQRGQITFRFKE